MFNKIFFSFLKDPFYYCELFFSGVIALLERNLKSIQENVKFVRVHNSFEAVF